MPPLRGSHVDGVRNNMPEIMLKFGNIHKEKNKSLVYRLLRK